MLEVKKTRHNWPENKILIHRPKGGDPDYIFLLFHNPITILLNGEEIKTKPGAMLIYDKSTPQYFCSDTLIYHDWIHITGELPQLMKECDLQFDTIYYPDNIKIITESVHTLETEFFSDKSHREALIDSTLRTMFYHISRDIRDEEGVLFEQNEILHRFKVLRKEVFASLEKNWTVAEMAASVCLSESRFYTLYHNIFGISPTKDLICARIDRARFYLESNQYTVNEIASLLGYSNVFHFIRQFKKYTGTTPGSYRD